MGADGNGAMLRDSGIAGGDESRENERRLRLALAAGGMGTWDWTIPTGRVVWSPELEELHGLAPGTFPGTFEGYQADFHPEDRERIIATIQRVVEERAEDYANEYRIVLPDGRVRWIAARGKLLLDAAGRPARMLGVCRDITASKKLELRNHILAEAGRVLGASLDLDGALDELSRLVVPDLADWYCVHLVEPDGRIEPARIAHANPAKVELAWQVVRRWPARADAATGVASAIRTGEASLQPRIDSDVIRAVAHDEEHARLLQELGLRSGMVVPLRARDRIIGALTFVYAESGRDYGADDLELARELLGRAALAIENAQLFAEAKAARREAERAAGRLDVLARAGATLATSLDPDETLQELARLAVSTLADYAITYALDADSAIRRVGLAHADPDQVGLLRELETLAPPRLDDAHGAGAVLRTGESILAVDVPPELVERAAQSEAHAALVGRLRPRSCIIVPLRARQRSIGAMALVRTDRSAQPYDDDDLALAQELGARAALLVDNARLYRDGQTAIRGRDEMLAVVSHDLRNPLNTVVMACDVLTTDLTHERRRRCHDSIARAAGQMNRLLDDLLDVVQIDEGRLSLSVGEVDLSAVISEVTSVFAPIAEEKEIGFRVSVAGRRGVRGDRDRLVQALCNLVGNAVKFSPNGTEVVIRAEHGAAETRISVIDHGPGIPGHQLPHIFDRFFRGNREVRDGVGLGLAIVHGIVEAHRGRIEVRSEPGAGAEFALILPVHDSPAAATSARA